MAKDSKKPKVDGSSVNQNEVMVPRSTMLAVPQETSRQEKRNTKVRSGRKLEDSLAKVHHTKPLEVSGSKNPRADEKKVKAMSRSERMKLISSKKSTRTSTKKKVTKKSIVKKKTIKRKTTTKSKPKTSTKKSY